MKQALCYLAASCLVACAPDIAANGAERCDEQAACGAGASCYRGFCVPDPSDGSTEESDGTDEIGEVAVTASSDAGMRLSSLDSGGDHDSGSPDPVLDAGAVADASKPDSGKPDAGEAGPAEPSDAGAPAVRPPPRTEDAASSPPPDAGAPVIEPPCTLKVCCDEARQAFEAGEKPDGRWNSKKGKCGCRDADLMSVLGCSVSVRGKKP